MTLGNYLDDIKNIQFERLKEWIDKNRMLTYAEECCFRELYYEIEGRLYTIYCLLNEIKHTNEDEMKLDALGKELHDIEFAHAKHIDTYGVQQIEIIE